MKKLPALLLLLAFQGLPAQSEISEKDSVAIFEKLVLNTLRSGSLESFEEGLRMSEEKNWARGIGFARYKIGAYKMHEGGIAAAALQLDKADSIFHKINYQTGLGLVLTIRAEIAYKSQDRTGQIELLQNAIRVFENEKDRDPIAVTNLIATYYELCTTSILSGDIEQARVYIDRGIDVAEKFENKVQIDNCYFLSGVTAHIAEDFKRAKKDYARGLELAKSFGDSTIMAKVLSKMGILFQNEGKPDSALIYYNKDLELSEALGSDYMIMNSNINLGGFYSQNGDLESGLNYLETAADFARESKNNHEYGEILKLLAKNREDAGDFKASIAHLNQFISFKDSMLNERRVKEIAELEQKYEAEIKEATIAANEKLIARQRSALLLAIAAAGMLFGLAILFYRNFKLKKRANEQLQKKNDEINLLIKEIHHRVKNNLQILASLLNLQSRYIKDPNALDAVKEGKNRVESMSLLHQKLYLGDNISSVNMPEYIKNLAENILSTFGYDSQPERLQMEIENINLDIDTAIPLGLIINELLTNSLKYAFSGKPQEAKVELHLRVDPEKQLFLRIADNGKNGSTAQSSGTSFGLSLVDMLSKKLKGAILTEHSNGYATEIRFKKFNLI